MYPVHQRASFQRAPDVPRSLQMREVLVRPLQQRVRLARKQIDVRRPVRRIDARFGRVARRGVRFSRESPCVASSITPPPFPGLFPRSPSVAPLRDGVFFVDRVAFALVNRSASASRVVAETCRGNSWSLSRTPPNRCVGARGSPPPPRATSPAAANALASRPSGPFWSITTDVVITSGTRSGDERTSDARSAAAPTGANSGSEKMTSPCLRFLVATPRRPSRGCARTARGRQSPRRVA